jgi:hypothetical protein
MITLAATEPLISATTAIIGAAGTIAVLLLAFGRIVWGAGRALRDVDKSLSDLRAELAEQRRTDGLEIRREMDRKIQQHAAQCPGREPTGVRALVE